MSRRPDEKARPHDEADPVREALDAFNADEALDDPDELEPERARPEAAEPRQSRLTNRAVGQAASWRTTSTGQGAWCRT